MTTIRKTQQNPKQKKDNILMVLLIFANIVSGYTTIDGASKVLPIAWAWILGSFIQILLFLALADLIMKTTPWRKWLTVALFTFLSVYTSFFTYYTTLAGNINTQNEFETAVQTHNKFVADVYTPLETRLAQQKTDTKILRARADKEAQGFNTGLVGKGDVYRKLQQDALEAEEKLKSLTDLVNNLEAKFKYEVEAIKPNKEKVPLLKPREIFKKDQEALASVPKEYLPEKYPDLKLENYIDKDLEVALITPIKKLSEGTKDANAIAALFIAFGVDVWSVILGTAITANNKRTSIIKMIGNAIANMKKDFQQAEETIKHGTSYDEDEEEHNLKMEIVKLMLRGKGSVFLTEFYQAIVQVSPHKIDADTFNNNHPNPTFQLGFRILIDKLHKRKWVKYDEKNNNWVVEDNYYDRVITWLHNEIMNLTEEENQLKIDDDWGFSPKNAQGAKVNVKIPY